MKEQGIFTDAQLETARAKLNSMSDDDLKEMTTKAQKAAQDPAYQKKAQEIIQNMKRSNQN